MGLLHCCTAAAAAAAAAADIRMALMPRLLRAVMSGVAVDVGLNYAAS